MLTVMKKFYLNKSGQMVGTYEIVNSRNPYEIEDFNQIDYIQFSDVTLEQDTSLVHSFDSNFKVVNRDNYSPLIFNGEVINLDMLPDDYILSNKVKKQIDEKSITSKVIITKLNNVYASFGNEITFADYKKQYKNSKLPSQDMVQKEKYELVAKLLLYINPEYYTDILVLSDTSIEEIWASYVLLSQIANGKDYKSVENLIYDDSFSRHPEILENIIANYSIFATEYHKNFKK